MKPEDFDNSASCAMHEKCKKCLLKDCCNVWKHYKALKENGCTYACDLICFMQNLDHAAMTVYKYLTAGNKAFIERRVKIYCIYYREKFRNLWKLYELYDKNNLTKDQKTEIIVYTCRILERYGVLDYFETRLGINLSRDYDNYIRHIIKMERAQNARNV